MLPSGDATSGPNPIARLSPSGLNDSPLACIDSWKNARSVPDDASTTRTFPPLAPNASSDPSELNAEYDRQLGDPCQLAIDRHSVPEVSNRWKVAASVQPATRLPSGEIDAQ